MKKYSPIGACGFFCGSCPSYSSGECKGCRSEHKTGDCFTLDCVNKKAIEFCGNCENFPCDEIILRERSTVLDKEWLKWKQRQKEK